MSNVAVVCVYLPFALINTFIFIVELSRRIKRSQDYLFASLCLCTVCWYAAIIFCALTKSEEIAKFLLNFVIVFVGFLPPLMLQFILKFYKIYPKHIHILNKLMFVIPLINIILAITVNHHSLLSRQLEILTLSPSLEIVIVRGAWFWVHTVYCYILTMIIIAIISFRHFRQPKFYRLPSALVVLGLSFALAGNLLTLSLVFPAAFDPTLIATSLLLICFDLAIINNNNSKFVRFSHAQLYHHLEEFILILDERQNVVDVNRPAQKWFSDRGIPLANTTISSLVEILTNGDESGQIALEDKKSIDLIIRDDNFHTVLNLRIHELTDADGDVIGSIAVFSDVSESRLMLERLEAKACMDSLTGLANRRAYEGARNRLDNPEYLPLSIIVCDADGLKTINDNEGHQHGDMLLRVIAEILEKECPPSGFIARIGGDEFIYLLPNTDSDSCDILMKQISAELADTGCHPFTASVSLGAATKYSEADDIQELIDLADRRMYENKRLSRRS